MRERRHGNRDSALALSAAAAALATEAETTADAKQQSLAQASTWDSTFVASCGLGSAGSLFRYGCGASYGLSPTLSLGVRADRSWMFFRPTTQDYALAVLEGRPLAGSFYVAALLGAMHEKPNAAWAPFIAPPEADRRYASYGMQMGNRWQPGGVVLGLS